MLTLADRLTKGEYALYGYYWTLASLLLIFINFGHKDAIFKFVSQLNTDCYSKLLASTVMLAALICSITIIISWLANLNLMVIAILSASLLHVIHIVSAFNRGSQNYLLDALAWPLYRTIWLGLLIVIILNVKSMSAIHVFATSIVAALATILFTNTYRVTKIAKWSLDSLRFGVGNSTVRRFFYIELVTVFFMRLDMIFINQFDMPAESIAGYFFSLQVYEAAIMLLMPITYLFFNQYNRSISQHLRAAILVKSAGLILLMFVSGLGLWLIFGEMILQAVFPKYLTAYDSITVFVFALLPNAINALLSAFLFANHKESMFVKVCIVGVLVMILFDVTFIGHFGVNAVAYGRLFAEWSMSFLLIGITFKMLRSFSVRKQK
ncbi:MAG: lipopolysaccharide biosynthesis protein [Aestuariibacter sp.]